MATCELTKNHDVLQAALDAFRRDEATLDLHLLKERVSDLLVAVEYEVQAALPHAARLEFSLGMDTTRADTTHALDFLIEQADFAASDPDTLAATEADHRRDMNR